MTPKRIHGGSDRGLSDVIAFTIVFSIIVVSVGLVSAVGFQALDDVERNEQGLNAQRALQSVSDNLAELQNGQTPARTSEIDARDGTISIEGAGPDVEINVTNSGGSLYNTTLVDLGTLSYELPNIDRTIAVEGGAVFTQQDAGEVMVEPPQFTCRGNTAIVSVIKMRPESGSQALSGSNVQIRGSYSERSALLFTNSDGTPKDVRINVVDSTTSFDSAWEDGIADLDGWSSTGSSAVECTGVKNVVVRVTVVNVVLR